MESINYATCYGNTSRTKGVLHPTPSVPTSNVISATVYNFLNDREYLQIKLSSIMSDFEGLTKGKQLNNVLAFTT